ncbi:DUF1513 domain-containing protein [Thiothrix subterranea]|uniref:DUF1513 domain-containing protein n=1 Tax=Thiothrix subterranea TaxID=2735563 RepID=A0AA51MQB2_9GAMM|nr:DUF1513 domain-containing protein [Thiothrix subterranea]MDQ5769478.1 DUF1513 domain-containing protein [Thiothrix subterranea]WML86311.1 DUF1513 domain-containing protein [Thiothrix subterranea]
MNRRQFLLLATAGTFGAALGVNALMKRAAGTPVEADTNLTRLYSASDNPHGGHFLTRLDMASGQLQSCAVPMRGHAVLPLANDAALLFGRRPAFECAVVMFTEAQNTPISATAGRHFNGHGCLSAAGDALFTTENAYDEKRGVLGIRDSKTFQHLGEYDTFGLDPHDVQLMPDGKTLVIANGGIEQHPDFGRRKLNLDTMQPSLVYLDAQTGKKIAEYRLPDRHLSIRHLIATADGSVGVALQYEGNLYRQQPASLVAWQPHGGELQLLDISTADVALFNGYMADLAYDPQQQILAVSSPRGNHTSFWSTRERRFLHAHSLPEPSGIAFLPQQQQFLVSDATGGIHRFPSTLQPAPASLLHQFPDKRWDNHLVIA